jgi:hypothetical protein
MNLKEAWQAINKVARSTYHDDATLVFNGNSLSVMHKGSVCWSPNSDMEAVEIPFNISSGLTIKDLKPIAKIVFIDFMNNAHNDYDDDEDSDMNKNNEYEDSITWARELLGELLT